MVVIDMKLPECCADCPCSYWIRSGKYEDRLMCNVMEYKDGGLDRSVYLVDEIVRKRPDDCPMREM